jgi:alpha,alpha-trehalase
MAIKNIFSLGELFERVQLESVFPDGKTFVDCSPKFDLDFTKEEYEKQKDSEEFSLNDFVKNNFLLPHDYSQNYVPPTGESILKHIDELWNVLTRQPEESKDSLIGLPFPYIVPGGRFREIYYWDSYFTMLGLQVSGRVDMIENMVKNFSFLIEQFGYIPNGNRTYYLGRSQPPFFSCMIQLLKEEKGDQVLSEYLPSLLKEYEFWMKGNELFSDKKNAVQHVVQMPDETVLNRYWDQANTPRPEAYKKEIELAEMVDEKEELFRNLRAAAASGWDFSSRWFKNKHQFSSIHTTDIIPVDLNCLLLHLEETIAEAYKYLDDSASSNSFIDLAEKRNRAINNYCWNEEKGFYFDYDFVEKRQTNADTLAASFPLYFKVATDDQAEKVAGNLKQKFLKNGGLITTTETTDQQWDAPNGWAPLQWISIRGLINYGFTALAFSISKRWLELNKKAFENTGKLMEKYNVVSTNLVAGGGEYPAQDGFGWTNGVYLALDRWTKSMNDKVCY